MLRRPVSTLRTELASMSRRHTAGMEFDRAAALDALISIEVVNRDAQLLADSCQDDVVQFRDAAEKKCVELANLEYEEMIR